MTTTIAPADAFITVAVVIEQDGEITRHAFTGQSIAPGLAITPAIGREGFNGEWTVTHVPSGHRVGAVRGCISCVNAAAHHLTASGVDWTAADRQAYAGNTVAERAANAFMDHVRRCDGSVCGMWAVA